MTSANIQNFKNLYSVSLSKTYVLSVLLMIGSSGCVMTRGQLTKEEEVEKAQALDRSVADQSQRLRDLEEDVRKLSGTNESVESHFENLKSENQELRKQIQTMDQDNKARTEALKEELLKQGELLSQIQIEVSKIKAPNATAEGKQNIKKEPSAQLWTEAESLYGQKEWRKAILAYQKFKESYPKHKNVPTAMLRSGIGFVELGMKNEAKVFFEELISQYPNTPESKTANARLKKLE